MQINGNQPVNRREFLAGFLVSTGAVLGIIASPVVAIVTDEISVRNRTGDGIPPRLTLREQKELDRLSNKRRKMPLTDKQESDGLVHLVTKQNARENFERSSHISVGPKVLVSGLITGGALVTTGLLLDPKKTEEPGSPKDQI